MKILNENWGDIMIHNLFISHSWTYSDAYKNLVNLLDADPYFSYNNYSVPKDDPIHNAVDDYQLKAAIRNKMQHTNCVLILAGVYSTYSKWINIEIQLAKEMGKKIIAIEPWGSERTSATVKNNANAIVKWQTSSIIKAIRGY